MAMACSKDDEIRKYLSSKYNAASGGETPEPEEEDDEPVYGPYDNDDNALPELDEKQSIEETPMTKGEQMDQEADQISDSDRGLPDLREPPPTSEDIAKVDDAKSKAVQAALMDKYSKIGDMAQVRDAQADQQYNNKVANIFEALEGFAKANSMAHGGAGVDSGFYQGLRNQGAQGVQNAMANRQAQIQGFLQQNELTRQVVEDQMKKGTYENQQKAAQVYRDMHDGTSDLSQRAVDSARALFPEHKDAIQDGMSAIEVDNLLKGIETKSRIDENAQARKAQLDFNMANKQTALTQKQNKIYADAHDKAVTPGRNQSVQQAMTGVANAQKALDLLKPYQNNLDQMPQDQANLLAAEVAKIASGGVASEGGQKSVSANTFNSNYQTFMGKVDNKPTGAQLGAFLQNQQRYLKDMMDTNQQTINTYQKQIYNGIKSSLTPEQDAAWKMDFPDSFPEMKKGGLQTGQNSPPPHGQSVVQNNVTFDWDGSSYVPRTMVGAR